MTQTFTYDGVALPDEAVELKGVPGFTSNADGSFGVGGLQIDDPDGSMTFTQLQEFSHDESACSQPRTFTGYLWNMRVGRGPYRSGAGRVYDFDFADLNWLLTLQPLRGATAKRPVETGDQRLAWLLASVALDGIVFDNGFVGSNPNSFDEADYRNQLATDVLADLCVSSSADTGRIFFVYRDNASGEPSLFIDRPTVALYDSTLEISNDLADVDDVLTFAPSPNVELEAGGEEIYCSVFFVYKTGQLYRHSATTHATYFAGAGFHRQAVFTTDRIGSLATATRHADAFLAAHAGTLDTLTVPITLPASKANLIEAGMRVRNKFTHLPAPFNSFGFLRVAQRTIALNPTNNAFYDLTLKLTNRTTSPVGGGDPGDFPHTVTPPSIVQQSAGRGSRAMASSITAGDTLVYVGSRRGGAFGTLAGLGYTEVRAQTVNGGGDGTGMFYKTAGASESTTLSLAGDGDVAGCWYELPGTWTPDTSDADTGSTVNLATGPITVASNAVTFTVAGQGRGGAYDSVAASLTFTPGAGWTEDLDVSVVAGHPNVFAAHRFDSGSITGNATNSGNGGLSGTDYDWGMQIASFVGSVTNEPPMQGQWVYNELASMAGAVGTLDYGYAAGSLVIRVDGVLISSASYTETNPAAGTFTLDWAPDADETVRVDYQGI